MSKKLEQTRLAGWEGPREADVDSIYEAIKRGNTNGTILDKAGRLVAYYVEKFRPMTEDGYTWFWALKFVMSSGNVAILIPWFQDWANADNSKSDRSIAVYTQGDVTEAEIALILRLYATAINSVITMNAERVEESRRVAEQLEPTDTTTRRHM